VPDLDDYRHAVARAADEASVTVASPMAIEMENLKSDLASVGGHLLACLE